VALGHGFLVEGQRGQVLLRGPPKRLPPFGCVDRVQPNLVLALVRVEQRDGVAVRYAHDAALDLLRTCVRVGDQADQAQRGEPPDRVCLTRCPGTEAV
jgi:hypothetical protein